MIPFHNNPTPSTSFVGQNRSEVLVDKLIVEFLISNKLPLETIEQPCFQSLLSEVARVGSGYPLPASCSSLFKESIPIVKDVLQYIQTVLNSCNTYGCTLVVHLKLEVEFLYEAAERVDLSELISGYSVYSPEGVIYTYKLDPSYPYVDSKLGQLIHEINEAIKKQTMLLLFHEDETHFRHFTYPVEPHSRYGCYHICAKEYILTLLNDICEKNVRVHKLLLDVQFRFAMPRDGKAWKKYDHPLFKLQAVIQHRTNLDDELWKDAINLIRGVGPLLHMLTIFDNFVPNVGYFYGAIQKAEFRLKHFCDGQPEKFTDVWDLFTEFKDQVLSNIHVVAAYLNPGYMFDNKNLLPSDFDWVLELFMDMGSFIHDEEAEEQRDLYAWKDPCLFSEEAISKLHTYHPVRWRQEFGGIVPQLQKEAIRILSQRVNCLSHFSHKHMFERQLDMLGTNAIFMEEFGKLKQSDEIFKPIDLNILDTPFKL